MKKTPNVKTAPLLNGPVEKTLLRLAFPMMFGMLSVILFNVVDTFYIGMLGTKELAAASYTFPVVYVVLSISMGLGIGTSSIVSRAIGEGNPHKIKRLTTDSLFFAFFVVLVVAAIGLQTIEPVFLLLGTEPELIPLVSDYMSVWYLGIVFLVIPMVGNSAIRATGDTKIPSRIMMIAAGVNVLLDPLFIFGLGPFPRMELTGAALATIISYSITFFAALWILHSREKMLDLRIPKLKEVLQSWKKLLHVGLPATATTMLVPVSNGILTRMLSDFGPEAVAAFGVGSRLESLALIGVMALSSIMGPFVGQNWSAGYKERTWKGVRFSLKLSMFWGIAVYIILMVTATPLAGLFNDNPEVIRMTVQFLWVLPLSYGLYGVLMLSNSTYNALQMPVRSSLLIIIRLFVLAIPLAYIGGRILGVQGIFIGVTLGNIIIGIIAFLWVRKCLTEDHPEIDGTSVTSSTPNLPIHKL